MLLYCLHTANCCSPWPPSQATGVSPEPWLLCVLPGQASELTHTYSYCIFGQDSLDTEGGPGYVSPHSRSWRSRCVCLRKNSKCTKHKSSVTHCVGEATDSFNQDFLGRNKEGSDARQAGAVPAKCTVGRAVEVSGQWENSSVFPFRPLENTGYFSSLLPQGRIMSLLPPRCPHLFQELVECVTLHDRGTLLRV